MEKKIEFKIGQETLRGSLFIPNGKGPFPAVIFFHGSGGVGETHFEAAKAIINKGIVGFAFNYKGAGISEGNFEDQSVEMGLNDGKAAVEFLLSQDFVDKNRVGFYGGSFGGFVATMLCNKFKVKSMGLTAAAAISPKLMNVQRDKDSQLVVGFEDSESYREIEKFKGSLLIAICELDGLLPKGMAEKYFSILC